MAAQLRLPRTVRLSLIIPEGPGLCETCREAHRIKLARRGYGYCSALCALFDRSLGELADAYAAAGGERLAAPVVAARTRLRAVAAVYDADRLGWTGPDERRARLDWSADVADGLILPVPYARAIAAVRELLAG